MCERQSTERKREREREGGKVRGGAWFGGVREERGGLDDGSV